MTPENYNSAAHLFVIYSNGSIDYDRSSNGYGVRPVINLNANIVFQGIGTSTNPYVVE